MGKEAPEAAEELLATSAHSLSVLQEGLGETAVRREHAHMCALLHADIRGRC